MHICFLPRIYLYFRNFSRLRDMGRERVEVCETIVYVLVTGSKNNCFFFQRAVLADTFFLSKSVVFFQIHFGWTFLNFFLKTIYFSEFKYFCKKIDQLRTCINKTKYLVEFSLKEIRNFFQTGILKTGQNTFLF